MLARQIERVERSQAIDRLTVATSQDPSDDAIERLCEDLGVPCFRGSLDDVLDRFYQGALRFSPEHVIRLTGDCPLADPLLIDDVVKFYLDGSYDYASNALEPTFPDGLDVEVFRFNCLVQAWKEADLPSHREHVTPFIYRNPERFRLGSFRGERDLSSLRWTVDESEDFELVKSTYEALYPQQPDFSTLDILEYLSTHHELRTSNTRFARNEGMKKSLQIDDKYLGRSRSD
jgi:spore coat polysaccharide biosynthesis protein SpsF